MGETCAAVVTWELVTGAGARGAVLAAEAQWTLAAEVVDAIDAGAGVAARVGGAVIDVGLTMGASEARQTAAHDTVAEDQTLCACTHIRLVGQLNGLEQNTQILTFMSMELALMHFDLMCIALKTKR